jgi:xylulokinase
MATSGSLTTWVRDLTGSDYETLTREAAAQPPGSDGLLLLPYFAGERTPVYDPDARGVAVGLTLAHRRGHLYRAVLEATAFGARHNLDAMTEGSAFRAVAVGGGATTPLWPQIVSDVTGVPQEIPVERIGAAYGDALLAAEGAGLVPHGSSWARRESEVVPGAEAHARYSELYRLYLELHPATAGIQHELGRFAAGTSP